MQESILSLAHRDKIDEEKATKILNEYHKNLVFYRQNLEHEKRMGIPIGPLWRSLELKMFPKLRHG
ncbi:hypothetical protein ACT7CZ_05320 [Bacillus cereus]